MKHLQDKHDTSSHKSHAKVNTLKRKLKDITGEEKDSSDSKTENFCCPHCTAFLSSHKNLQRHIRDVHSIETMPMICVDIRNGLYVTPKHEHSPHFPIHVVKSTNPPKIDCEVENCRKFMQIAWSSGNPGKECVHLERTKHAKQYVKPAELTPASLKVMLEKGLMSTEWGEKCEKLDTDAKNCKVDSVFPVNFGEKGHSQRWFFFSVFTNKTDNWCQFRRTRVTFDAVVGKWNCQCKGSQRSHRCIHRMMAMWWIFQESPDTLMPTSDVQAEDIQDLESHMMEDDISCTQCSVTTQKICAMTDYIHTQKRIPPLKELSLNLRTQEETPSTTLVPLEKNCPYCPGPTPPELGLPKVVTTQATVYGINYVKKGNCAILFLILVLNENIALPFCVLLYCRLQHVFCSCRFFVQLLYNMN
ncbi:uncharacterized protein [Nothobranchius furzeri]|uniref:uncharacterized protein n=1 Tax=Nothobranchius furzeri TaxID=105023 RepID=UPI0039048ED4